MNSSSKTTTVVKGVSLPTVISVVFIILKLTHVIEWQWIWVLSPIWIGLSAELAFVLIAFGIVVMIQIVQSRK